MSMKSPLSLGFFRGFRKAEDRFTMGGISPKRRVRGPGLQPVGRVPSRGVSGATAYAKLHELPPDAQPAGKRCTTEKSSLVPLLVMAALLAVTAHAADAVEKTGKLIAVIQSDASFFEKARACQQLGEIGTREAVPALAALLADEHLSAYARSGLEGIPDPSARAALREATATLKGPRLIGVVNSLGTLRDTQAVELLRRVADDPNAGATKEALLALGNIASPEAIRIIKQALAFGPDATRGEVASARLLAADRQRNTGSPNEALALYDLLRTAQVPLACRVGATRGAILARGADRVPFLVEQLRSDEPAIRNAALLTIREIPDASLAAALNAELAQAKPELQQQLLQALVDCHNPQSIPAVAALAGSMNPEIRRTALTTLGRLGPGAAPALLAALRQDQPPELKAVVLSGLKAMPGTSVDDVLAQALRTAVQPTLRVDLIRLLSARGAARASGDILAQATGPDRAVSLVAVSALQSLAGVPEVPGLIRLLKSSQDEAIKEATENALASAAGQPAGQAAVAEAILTELRQATAPADKNRWVRILAAVGSPAALPVIEAATRDLDSTVADNALAHLGRWPDPAPIDTLLQAMETSANRARQKCALGSVIDLAATAADEAQRPAGTIVGWLQRANAAARSIEEKRRILGVLGRCQAVESFRLLMSYLDDPNLRNEAAAGLVQIAPALAGEGELKTVVATLQQVAATRVNADLKRRAREVLKSLSAQTAGVSLFDGHSLAGWEGDTNVWRVRDAVIVGGSVKGNPRNEFLATVRSYTNFLLRLEYKLVGTEGFVNSGVQFRSVRVHNPPNEMNGYQADIGAGYSGCLYDESRRNMFLARCRDGTLPRLEKPGDWNLYELRCEGPHIQIWLNGEKTVDYAETDATIPQAGLIGLQIHGGNKAEVSFRHITIQEFLSWP